MKPLKLSGKMRVIPLREEDRTYPPSIPWNPHLRELAHGFMCTAIEGGIGYWCQLRRYSWYDVDSTGKRWEEAAPAGVNTHYRCKPVMAYPMLEDESGYTERGVRVSAGDMLKALRRIVKKDELGFSIAGQVHWAKKAAGWLLDPENADYDSGDADVVFQVAALGKVIYG